MRGDRHPDVYLICGLLSGNVVRVKFVIDLTHNHGANVLVYNSETCIVCVANL